MEIKQSLKAKANEGNELLELQLKSARQEGKEEAAAAAICVGGGRGVGSVYSVDLAAGSWQPLDNAQVFRWHV